MSRELRASRPLSVLVVSLSLRAAGSQDGQNGHCLDPESLGLEILDHRLCLVLSGEVKSKASLDSRGVGRALHIKNENL